MFGLLRALRRWRLSKSPFPPSWLEVLDRSVPFYRALADPLRQRFLEEKRVHRMHCPGPLMAAVYGLYWLSYLPYRRIRAMAGTS